MRTLTTVRLASASPRRRDLLTSLGVNVTVVASSYVERPLAGVAPRDLALAHARGKAAGTAQTDALVVAADTVVDVDGDALGKPVDVADARAMIRRLSGRWHSVHTAFALRDDGAARNGSAAPTYDAVVTTRVRFAALGDDAIARYAASGDGLDKAGAYGIQGFAATLVEQIQGDYFAVVGFPLAAFAQALPQLGLELLPARAGEAVARLEVSA